MSALHTIVDPALPQQPPPQFTLKPQFPTSPHDGYSPFIKHPPGAIPIHQDTGEEDIEDDEDEDDLEEGEDDELDDSYPSFHLAPNTTIKEASVSHPNTNSTSYPPNNYLSINHIISPNPSQLPPQPQTARNNTTTTSQTSNTGISGTESTQNPPVTPQGNAKKDVIEEKPLDLLIENRHLRKKVEGLMGHNMQLMLGIKERDHKIHKQKRLLVKYRKALLRFFEENETSSSSDDELANMSPNEYKAARKKEAKLDLHLRNVPPTLTSPPPPLNAHAHAHANASAGAGAGVAQPNASTPGANAGAGSAHGTNAPGAHAGNAGAAHAVRATPPASPSSPIPALFPSPSYEEDDESLVEFDFDVSKKRKSGGGEFADLEPDKKRRGPRRNALWTAEDDEMFQKVYNMYGKSWKTIHNYMPGKTREQVQSHGQYLIRIGKLEDVKSGQRTRGRKPKKDISSPTPSHSSSHHSHHSSHHSHTHPSSLSSPQPSPSQPPPSMFSSFSSPSSLSHLPYDEQGSIV